MNLIPTRGRVIVQKPPKETETTTESGIILAGAPQDKPTESAIVVAVGTGVTEVKVGDNVMFGMYSGQSVKYEGTEFLVLSEGDIMLVIEDATA